MHTRPPCTAYSSHIVRLTSVYVSTPRRPSPPREQARERERERAREQAPERAPNSGRRSERMVRKKRNVTLCRMQPINHLGHNIVSLLAGRRATRAAPHRLHAVRRPTAPYRMPRAAFVCGHGRCQGSTQVGAGQSTTCIVDFELACPRTRKKIEAPASPAAVGRLRASPYATHRKAYLGSPPTYESRSDRTSVQFCV